MEDFVYLLKLMLNGLIEGLCEGIAFFGTMILSAYLTYHFGFGEHIANLMFK